MLPPVDTLPISLETIELVEIGKNFGDDALVFPIPALRDVGLRHRLEVHRSFLVLGRHRKYPNALNYSNANVIVT